MYSGKSEKAEQDRFGGAATKGGKKTRAEKKTTRTYVYNIEETTEETGEKKT